jgi:transposase
VRAAAFRGRSGKLIKILLWHDGLGMSVYAKRLERGKFIWPAASTGAVSISTAPPAVYAGYAGWIHFMKSFRRLADPSLRADWIRP